MGLIKWIFIIAAILIVGFILASPETQEKIIKNSPEIIGNILEKLQNTNESTITQINNINYEKVGKPIRTENVTYDCETDDMCDQYFNECLNKGGCKSKEVTCYFKNI